ncbi:hypothetical protein K1719_005638 [Acacia pycnantha]|nr:hypothetical protein K1719_005638 [Acacia pycnantha]
MASEKDSSRGFDSSSGNSNMKQGISMEEASHTNCTNKSNMGKELARRALLRSHQRRNGRRKVANNSVKSLPSRLSKVSLADDSGE